MYYIEFYYLYKERRYLPLTLVQAVYVEAIYSMVIRVPNFKLRKVPKRVLRHYGEYFNF